MLVWVVVGSLICLSERMVVRLPSSVVSEPSKIRFVLACLLDLDADNLDLVICKPDFNFEHIWHDKFIRFN